MGKQCVIAANGVNFVAINCYEDDATDLLWLKLSSLKFVDRKICQLILEVMTENS